MNVYRLTRHVSITLEIVADTLENAERIADNTASIEHYPEVDVIEGDLDGAGRVTLLSVAPPPVTTVTIPPALHAAHVAHVAAALATAGRSAQEAAADALAAALTAGCVNAEHIGAGIVDTQIDVERDGHDGAARLHVHEDGALVTLAITFYDPADEDQPGRPVDDEDLDTFPACDVSNILTALAHLANEQN